MSFNPFSPFRGFGGGAFLSLDPDAAAYIAALETAGATVTPTQSAAIDAFIVAEKAGSRWAAIKSFYLPIWGLAAPNAICAIRLTSGTYNGVVTHAAGYVQGNVTSGYFQTGAIPSTLGLTNTSFWHGRLVTANAAGNQEGAYPVGSTTTMILAAIGAGGFFTEAFGFSGGVGRTSTPLANYGGIFSMHYASGVFRQSQRLTSGRTNVASITRAGVGTVPAVEMYDMARNQNPVAGTFSGSPRGAWWLGTGVSDADDAAFTANLKTLWETCTGLTLP